MGTLVTAGTAYFGAHTDPELRAKLGAPHENESVHLRAMLNWHALFHDRLFTTDAQIIYDPLFRELIEDVGYRRFEYELLLREGIIVTAVRDTETSLEGVFASQLKAANYSARHAGPIGAYASRLDDLLAHRVAFRLADVGKRYSELIYNVVGTTSTAEAAGIGRVRDRLLTFLDARRTERGVDSPILRTDLWDFAATCVPDADGAAGRHVLELGTTAYHANGASLLGGAPVYPHSIDREGGASAVLHRYTRSDQLRHDWYDKVLCSFQSDIPFHLLGDVPFGAILEIRRGEAFRNYMAALNAACSTLDGEQQRDRYWHAVARALPEYWASLEVLLRSEIALRNAPSRPKKTTIQLVGTATTAGSWGLRILQGVKLGVQSWSRATVAGLADFLLDLTIASVEHVNRSREAELTKAQRAANIFITRAKLDPLPPRIS